MTMITDIRVYEINRVIENLSKTCSINFFKKSYASVTGKEKITIPFLSNNKRKFELKFKWYVLLT